MYKSIQIKNLRAIKELEIDNLGQVNLFVGRNNCGKTTILEALFFLIGAPNPKLPISVNSLRGLSLFKNELWHTFFHNMESDACIQIVGELRKKSEKHKLTVRVKEEEPSPTPLPTSDIVSAKIENGQSESVFVTSGLELEYTSRNDAENKTISQIYVKDGKIVTEGAKTAPTSGLYMNQLTAFDWKDRFDIAQTRKKVPELISLLKEVESQIIDLRLNAVGLLEVDIGLLVFHVFSHLILLATEL